MNFEENFKFFYFPQSSWYFLNIWVILIQQTLNYILLYDRRILFMKKFFRNLCTALLLSAVVAIPFNPTTQVSISNSGISTNGFYVAIEGQ